MLWLSLFGGPTLRCQAFGERVFVNVVLVVELRGGEATYSLTAIGTLHARHFHAVDFLVVLQGNLVHQGLRLIVHRVSRVLHLLLRHSCIGVGLWVGLLVLLRGGQHEIGLRVVGQQA